MSGNRIPRTKPLRAERNKKRKEKETRGAGGGSSTDLLQLISQSTASMTLNLEALGSQSQCSNACDLAIWAGGLDSKNVLRSTILRRMWLGKNESEMDPLLNSLLRSIYPVLPCPLRREHLPLIAHSEYTDRVSTIKCLIPTTLSNVLLRSEL